MTLLAYLNGQWIAGEQLSISVDDVGFLLGATITERLRTFRGEVFRLEEHLQRMRRSLTTVGLDAKVICAELADAIPQFAAKNAGQIAPEDDWSISTFATPGIAGSSTPTVCVHGRPLPFGNWADAFERGVSAIVSDVRQVPDNCWPSEMKCRSRMHYYLAERQAAAFKPGARAILLDQEGYIAESTTANVLVYRAGEGLSSPPDDHILVGISLGVIHELAGRLGVPFMRRRIAVDELATVDEMMLASTSMCNLPVVECDGKPVGEGSPGPIYRKLLAAWGEMVGVNVAAQAKRFALRQPLR